ncbi:hypothetical protein Godav_019409, partial [Gossypium davidsonii]|nr:hypothetical protein [Gossypium davidsonii]
HRINAFNTNVYFSQDVEEVDANATSIFLGFQRVLDLSKYLAVPLFHKYRDKKSTFQFIIYKVHGRLNGWDAKLASRVTLAKSGGSSSTLKIYSVNWKDVCQPSKSGGIELRIFGDQHRCFLLKCNGEYHFKGGLIQDEFGRWGVGFTKLIGICSTFEVELWVIYESLNLTWGRGFRRVDMEPDSLIAAKMSNA